MFQKGAALLFSLALAVLAPQPAVADAFEDFVSGFRQKAMAAGISPALYDELTKGLVPDRRVPNLIAGQPEFTTPIWDYLDARVSSRRIAAGQAAFAANKALLTDIGARYGVDPHVIAAIWGVETDFGAILGNELMIRPIVPALFTVSAQHRGRWAEDEAELIAAMRLIQDHGWTNKTLAGSWAGAIGHTQLIVSAVLRYGTDGDGDGRVDPVASRADAFATTAAYLKGLGYVSGTDWGYEVEIPDGFDLLLASRESLRPVRFFAERGVTRVAGRTFRDLNEGVFLYLPAGADGPAFLMTSNYLAFKGYNFSDSYALSVAHLTDRLKGGGAFARDWPRKVPLPNLAQRNAIQSALKTLGYYDGVVDGRIGPVSQRAFALFQADRGLPADGFITARSLALLESALP